MTEKQRPDDQDPELTGDDDATDGELEAFAEAIAVSLRPRDIDLGRHEDILARALGVADEDDAADPEEQRRADVLRALLEGRPGRTTDGSDAPYEQRLAGLARALRLAYAPHEIDQLTSERLLKPSLKLASVRTARGYVAATTLVLAVAAALLLFFVRPEKHPGPSAQLPMIGAHSTMDLFDPAEPFPRSGGTTSRIDTIEESRDSELRDNLFASWGVE